ncbi:MAG: hypothetical protein ACREDF_02660, partial [Thermoplasmata archaeon]
MVATLLWCGAAYASASEEVEPAAVSEPFVPVSHVKPAPPDRSHPPVESAVDGATIYHNEGDLFKSAINPNPVLEDITLQPNDQPLEIRSIEFAYFVNSSVNLLIEVRFWDNFNPTATPVNSGLLHLESFDLGDIAHPIGGFVLGPSSLTSPVPLVDNDLAIQFDFLRSTNGNSVNQDVTILFSGTGVTVGSSPDRFYRDTNNNGRFDPLDSRNFGGAPNLANFYLHLRGIPSPNVVDPGMDLWTTPGGGTAFRDFEPGGLLFPGFFDFSDAGADCSNGNGSSDELTGHVPLKGTPILSEPPGALGPTDTIV